MKLLSNVEIRQQREKFGLSQGSLAFCIGVSLRSLRGFELGILVSPLCQFRASSYLKDLNNQACVEGLRGIS